MNDPHIDGSREAAEKQQKIYLATVSKEKKQQECTQMEKQKKHYPHARSDPQEADRENYPEFSFCTSLPTLTQTTDRAPDH